MKISLLQNERDNRPEQVEIEWGGLVTLLTSDFIRTDAKAGSPAWCPVEFSPPIRSKENARAVWAATYDFDDVTPEQFTSMLAKLDASGIAAIVHSSFSHTPEKPKARVVFKLSRPVLSGEWPVVWEAIPRMLDLKVNADPACRDASRLYYLACAKPDAPTFAATTDGTESIDVDALLAYASKQKFEQAVEAKLNPPPVQSSTALAPPVGPVGPVGAVVAADGSVNMDAIRATIRALSAPDTKVLAQRVLKGEVLSAVGNAGGGWGRDTSLQKFTGALVFALPNEVPTEAMIEVMRPSIAQMEPPEAGSRFETWFEFAADMIERARERKRVRDAERATYNDNARARLGFESHRSADVVHTATGEVIEPDPNAGFAPYTEAQLALWCVQQGCDSLAAFERRWIIQKDMVYYVFVEGKYKSALIKDALQTSLQRDLARSPLVLYRPDKEGMPSIPRSAADLIGDYSTVARSVEASLMRQISTYDPGDQVFHEAVCPLRNIAPRNHPAIQRWLELFGREQIDKLLDWVASVTRLDRQACAVYVDGVPGGGKTLLANGLARLWTKGGPAELSLCLEGFNESLERCPLVFADEALPRRKGVTADLRRLVGSTSRTLNRKYKPACNLEGALRVILAGNNDRLMETGEDLSKNDLEAVSDRFLYLQIDASAKAYLDGLTQPVVDTWIKSDLIAEHALYLRESRTVAASGRFLVKGGGAEFHDRLATSGGMGALVCEWLARYLSRGGTPQKNTFMMIGEGELWVHTEALASETSWNVHLPSHKVATGADIARALNTLSAGSIAARGEAQTLTYYRLKVDLIMSCARRLQLGDLAAIAARINAPNAAMAEAISAVAAIVVAAPK